MKLIYYWIRFQWVLAKVYLPRRMFVTWWNLSTSRHSWELAQEKLMMMKRYREVIEGAKKE